MKSRLLLYGADVYAGGLIARRAAERGFAHIAAGQDIARVATLANELSKHTPNLVEPRIFGLGDISRLADQLDDVAVLVNCAYASAENTQALINACIASRTHYVNLDMETLDLLQDSTRNSRLVEAGITVVPGAAFDVSAADVMAARLAAMCPNATHLTLAISRSQRSQDEARQVVSACRAPGHVLRDGRLVEAAVGERSLKIDFGKGPLLAHLAPWRSDGEIAFLHGPFRNVDAYEVLHPALVRTVTKPGLRRWMFRRGMRIGALERKLAGRREGPTSKQLAKTGCVLWGEARDAQGHIARARLETPAAPLYTADATIAIVRALMDEKTLPGVHFPSQVAGAALVESIDGVHWRELPDAAAVEEPDGRAPLAAVT